MDAPPPPQVLRMIPLMASPSWAVLQAFGRPEGRRHGRVEGYRLLAGQPTTQAVFLADIAKGGTVEVPTPKYTIAFALHDQAGKIGSVVPGVRRRTLSNGVVYEYNIEKPLHFQHDQMVFVGSRGGIFGEHEARTTRLVMLDGTTIDHGTAKADVASGPYDLTFQDDKVVGFSEGPGRFVNITQSEGIVMMLTVTSSDTSNTPGTCDRVAVVPLLDDRYEFLLESLKQPPRVSKLATVVDEPASPDESLVVAWTGPET